MWNKRFAQEEYVYGEQPNEFFKEQILKLKPGRLLLPAEGEGRNAVFAARLGWEVVAFDTSSVAIEKAQKLAIKHQVTFEYIQGSYHDINLENHSFDCIALIFAHDPNQANNHKRLLDFLKKDGVLILEGFSKDQIHNATGGPTKLEMLFSDEELRKDFKALKSLEINSKEVFLNEGKGHHGACSTIQLLGKGM